MLRYLRLTVAVACLPATACFVILWMRSDAVKDVIWVGGDSPRISRISTPPGRLVLSTRRSPYEGKWAWDCSVAANQRYLDSSGRSTTNYWFRILRWPQFTEVHLPMWLLTLIVGGIGVACACAWPSRFSLRGLLISTTIVALVLGLGLFARTWHEPEPIAIFGGVRLIDLYE